MKCPILPTVLCAALLATACGNDPVEPSALPAPPPFTLENASCNGQNSLDALTQVDPSACYELRFSAPLDETTLQDNILLTKPTGIVLHATIHYDGGNTVRLTPEKELQTYTSYTLVVEPGLRSAEGGKITGGKVIPIFTGISKNDRFDRINDEALLTLVQCGTFSYFSFLKHLDNQMIPEHASSKYVATPSSTGLGIMAIIIAAERGFITPDAAVDWMHGILSFLRRSVTRFKGVFPCRFDTRNSIPSNKEEEFDLQETAMLMQGLLMARAYLRTINTPMQMEKELCTYITQLWEDVEWNDFVLYPEQRLGRSIKVNTSIMGWIEHKVDTPITGWNEALITYVLAASSPTYPIDRYVYEVGWARNGKIHNGNRYYDITLPLGGELGGPLCYAHDSFLGLNPKGLKDAYADYWEQNRAHTLINYRYCVDNPHGYIGYGPECWGLTTSYSPTGYNAWSPTNDSGVITPAAALSSMPYTPEESMAALRFFYYKLGDKLWSEYGFIESFNLTEQQFDCDMYTAKNQASIMVMIENYRTGLPWRLFMSDPDVQRGLQALGFTVDEQTD